MPLIRIDESVDVSLTWRIEVPRARAWQCLTEAGLLAQWLGELVSGAVGPESDFVIDHGDDCCCRSTVVTCAEPSRLDFSWHFPEEPASRVSIELEESKGITELRLDHGGLGDLAESYRDGWCVHLSYLEAAALGSPLPRAMFWRLHGTVAQLNAR
ncbi:MAG TPA: SRPBCC domain-containing protein [Marmoricola sp.]